MAKPSSQTLVSKHPFSLGGIGAFCPGVPGPLTPGQVNHLS
jgi:hypothetical protein